MIYLASLLFSLSVNANDLKNYKKDFFNIHQAAIYLEQLSNNKCDNGILLADEHLEKVKNSTYPSNVELQSLLNLLISTRSKHPDTSVDQISQLVREVRRLSRKNNIHSGTWHREASQKCKFKISNSNLSLKNTKIVGSRADVKTKKFGEDLHKKFFCNQVGEVDGLVFEQMNEHIVSTSSGGAEIRYFRIVKTSAEDIVAKESFVGYPKGASSELTKPIKHRNVTIHFDKKRSTLSLIELNVKKNQSQKSAKKSEVIKCQRL